MADLPAEILIDILSRLSIKTILTCRFVSKTWRNLLSSSNSQFTKHHFSRSPVQFILQTQTSLLHRIPNSLNFPSNDGTGDTFNPKFSFQIVELEGDTDVENSFKAFLNRFSFSHFALVAVNSCNGFLCLAESDNILQPMIIWNPITGEYLSLPGAGANQRELKITDHFYGFGFSTKTNQYKVVRSYKTTHLYTTEDRRVEVFTIGTQSWRTIGIETAFKFPDRLSSATFFNGAIHWLVHDELTSDFIISFDIETEEFGIVPPPPHFSTEPVKDRWSTNIGVLGEFLYLTHNTGLWVMKEYGVQESWIKAYFVDRPDFVDRPVYSHQPIKYLSGGKILMNYDNRKLISYDPVENICKDFMICKEFKSLCIFKTIAHVPSFMSFNDAMMGDKGAKLPTTMSESREETRVQYNLG